MLIRLVAATVILAVTNARELYGYDNEDSSEYESEPEYKYNSHKGAEIPYHFGYEIADLHGRQHRHEHRDTDGTVKGSYGYVDAEGVHRQVFYVADEHGYRAQVITNEMGTESKSPADVHMHSLYIQKEVPSTKYP